MENQDILFKRLDEEFDKILYEMKPYVLQLSLKSERQQCALWIKKLCEPVSGIVGRKNRNSYTRLMLQMLKQGKFDGPFLRRPEDGLLPPLPSNMENYFGDIFQRRCIEANNNIPDWVVGELPTSTLGSHQSYCTKKDYFSSLTCEAPKQMMASSDVFGSERAPFSSTPAKDSLLFSPDDLSANVKTGLTQQVETTMEKPLSRENRDQTSACTSSKLEFTGIEDEVNWSRPISSLNTVSSLKGPLIEDASKMLWNQDKADMDVKIKMVEARFHEEKLRIQQKHDVAVQKILDRKNAEIEDLKAHCRAKVKGLDEIITKLEGKVQTLLKESSLLKVSKEKQITEVKKQLEEAIQMKKSDFEKKLHDIISEFEQEKLDMQKQHTQNIQDLLDDTNARLQKMEQNYNHQSVTTAAVIKELEARVHQLTADADHTTKAKNALEKENKERNSQFHKFTTEMEIWKTRYNEIEKDYQREKENHEHELKSLRNKCETNVEILKQENSIALTKATEAVTEKEQYIDHLNRELQAMEEENQRQIKQLEETQQLDKLHMESLTNKQVRALGNELESKDMKYQQTTQRLEQIIREKDGEIRQLIMKIECQAAQAESALEEFKSQVSENQEEIYMEMRNQMERVEADLNCSKQIREKQVREFNKHLEEERLKHEKEVGEIKMVFEQEKSQLLREHHVQKELKFSEHEREKENIISSFKIKVQEHEIRLQERTRTDGKKIDELECEVGDLQQQLTLNGQLHKQQLVELGLLRDEEKQKLQREYENQVRKLQMQLDEQRLDLQKAHSLEMEKALEKTSVHLKELEKEYLNRDHKANETISELQITIYQLREDIKKQSETSGKRWSEVLAKHEEDRKLTRRQHAANVLTLQQELDSKHCKVRALERQLEQQEAVYEEKVTQVRLKYEEKIKGLMPAIVRQELEDTISSLKLQVVSLHQSVELLQEEVERRQKYSNFGSGPAQFTVS